MDGGGGGGEGKVLEGEKDEMDGSEMKPCLSIVDTCCFDFDEFSPPIEEEEEEKLKKKLSDSVKMLLLHS